MSVDWYVLQFEDAGIRGVQGRVEVAGNELGWDQVVVLPSDPV